MEQFSLEKYLVNPSRKVVTRDGREVEILKTNRKDGIHPIIFTILDQNGVEQVHFCNEVGICTTLPGPNKFDGLYCFWVDYKKSFLNNETYEMAKPFWNSDWTIVKKDGLYNILHKTGTHLLPNWVEYAGEYVWKEECAFVVDNGEEKIVTVNTLLN